MRAICLMYHELFADGASPDSVHSSIQMYASSESAFVAHLHAIQRSGLSVRRADEWLAHRDANDDSMIISFDDGWMGSLTLGVEALLKFGWRGTFFITRDYIGQPHFATATELRQAHAAGMELAGHGTTHRYLGNLSEADVRAEFGDVKKYLEDLTGAPVRTASVPGGDWSPTVARIVRECGYEGLFTSYPGVNRANTDRWKLKRLAVRSAMTEQTIERYVHFSITGEVLRHRVLELPKRLLGMQNYAKIRRMVLGGREIEEVEITQPK